MKNALVVCLIFLLSLTVFAADFNGTWTLNKEKSELGEGRGARMAATKLVVAQKDNSLTIESTRAGRDGEERTLTDEMTLDGKESKKSTDRAETVSSALIEGEKLKINQVRTFSRNGETMELKSLQEWTLDGKTLIINLTAESPRGEREMKLAYDKK